MSNSVGTSVVFAVYEGCMGSVRLPHGLRLLSCVFDNGRVIWADPWREEPTYFSGNIEKAHITNTIQYLQGFGCFASGLVNERYIGFDIAYTGISLSHQDNRLHLASIHEIFERNPGLVAGEAGLRQLHGQYPLNALVSEPSGYIRFRLLWNELRLAAQLLIPKVGTRIDGELKQRDGGYWWHSDEVSLRIAALEEREQSKESGEEMKEKRDRH